MPIVPPALLLLMPAAPSVVPPPAPAVERELAFPGFNRVPLRGTVRGAAGHGHFAVMVAGPGPTDRDWSSPLLRDPLSGASLASHAGRDFAAWLGSLGIGSLRYDKRFIGSRDPALDISLDAQVGDLRAALAAARALPEARGRKLLLVGHSEGALLSLLAASEADALLLLALPPLPMGRLILDQVKAQLPPALQAANLGHLEAVLQALREGLELPAPGPEVHPAVAQLGRGLASPESRAFVRATLDLDPWALLARAPVPAALAYGDRDLQCRRPATLPAGFTGTLIDLPEANHLLKRETRPLAGLAGTAAVRAYGDDTPQADLGPLAAWLRALR